MIAFARLMLFCAVGSAIAYWLLRIYYRSLHREELEKDWDANPRSPDADARETYIESGMATYEHSLRRRLLWLVVILPFVAVATLAYLIN